MSGFDYKPPKEFGERSPLGLGALRSLHQIPNLPFAKVESGDTVTVKANGFDTVTRKPIADPMPKRIITEGFSDGDAKSTLRLAGDPRAPFHKYPLALSGGNLGKLVHGTRHSIVNLDTGAGRAIFDGVEQFVLDVLRSKGFGTPVHEVHLVFAAQQTSDHVETELFVAEALIGSAVYCKRETDHIEFETVTFSPYDSPLDVVMPRVIYSNPDGNWGYANNVQGYAEHDHATCFQAQLQPDVHLICHAPQYKEITFHLTGRHSYPSAGDLDAYAYPVPLPLFQLSIDSSRNFQSINLDVFFLGAELIDFMAVPHFASFDDPVHYPTPSEIGFGVAELHRQAMAGLSMATLSAVRFFCFEIEVPSTLTIGTAAVKKVELRMYRQTALDFVTVERIEPPPGYRTTWGAPLVNGGGETNTFRSLFGAPLYPAFATASPGIAIEFFGIVGFVARVPRAGPGGTPNLSDPDLLYVSLDNGDTWEAPRPLPCIARYGGTVQALTSRMIGMSVYMPAGTAPGSGNTVYLYTSDDLGITWTQRKLVSENADDLGSDYFLDLYQLNDFLDFLVLETSDDTFPTANPMAGWQHDSRNPRLERTPPP